MTQAPVYPKLPLTSNRAGKIYTRPQPILLRQGFRMPAESVETHWSWVVILGMIWWMAHFAVFLMPSSIGTHRELALASVTHLAWAIRISSQVIAVMFTCGTDDHTALRGSLVYSWHPCTQHHK